MKNFEQSGLPEQLWLPLEGIYSERNDELEKRYNRIDWNSAAYEGTRRDDKIPDLIKAANIAEDHTILEAMCGTGKVALKIKESFPTAKIYGLDFSQGMLKKIPDDEVVKVESSILVTPFQDDTFDRVLLRSAIYDLPKGHQLRALKEISRIMKKDAIFILQTYITNQDTIEVLNDIANMKDRLAGQYRDMGEKYSRYFATKDDLEGWFKKASLSFELVQDFSSNIKLQKTGEMDASAQEVFAEFMAHLPKEGQKAINLQFDEKGGYTYDLPAVIFKLTK